MEKLFPLVVFLLFFCPSNRLFAKTDIPPPDLFEDAVFHYFNEEPEIAISKLTNIEHLYENSSTLYEYKARCYWQLAKKMANLDATAYRENPPALPAPKDNIKDDIGEKFIKNIDKAIKISSEQFQKEESPAAAYNLAMALSTQAGYLIQMRGRRGALDAGLLLEQAVEKIQFCIKSVPPYCLAYFPLGTTQYFMAKEITDWKWLGYKTFARFQTPNLYKTINLDKEEAIEFVETASLCDGPSFRKTEILFTLQGLLMDFDGNQKRRYEKNMRAFPILLDLTKKYPNNKKVKENLILVLRYFELKNKSR